MSRLATFIVGVLYWIVFSLGTIATILIGEPFDLVAYLLFGTGSRRDWVYATGKGLDGLCNAAWFLGNPKETISSHTGRIYLAAEKDPTVIIITRFKFVKWLTDLFEQDHVLKSIEAPFLTEPLYIG